jgi:hypothetical protein
MSANGAVLAISLTYSMTRRRPLRLSPESAA